MQKFATGIFILLLIAGGFIGRAQTVSTASLLREMTDFNAVTYWPKPYYSAGQASSYDRHSIAPDKPGWFANGDNSQFIRAEQNEGHKEYVMLDQEGPGALVRFWLTTFKTDFKYDLEMLGWAHGEADCAATTYWYGFR